MRNLTDHRVNGLNEAITITAQDNPGPGGANHIYQLDLVGGAPLSGGLLLVVNFQNGPIKEEGFNGFTNEALLAVLIDRMRGFQYERNENGSFNVNSRGKYACKENAQALTYMEEAMMWLQKRTRDRIAAGIEGTMQVDAPKTPPVDPNWKPGLSVGERAAAIVAPIPAADKSGKEGQSAVGTLERVPVEEKVDYSDPKLQAELKAMRPQTPARSDSQPPA